jgi:hypothetical protein
MININNKYDNCHIVRIKIEGKLKGNSCLLANILPLLKQKTGT